MKLLALLLLLPGLAVSKSCPPGTTVFKDTCVQDDAQPYLAEAVKPSDEKPPSEKLPSYQREGIKVINLPTVPEQDAEWRRKRDAAKEVK